MLHRISLVVCIVLFGNEVCCMFMYVQCLTYCIRLFCVVLLTIITSIQMVGRHTCSLLSKNTEIKIYRNIILFVVLYECETEGGT